MACWTFPIGHPASTPKLTQSISFTDSVLSSPFQISRHGTKAPNKKAPGWKSKLMDLHCLPSNSFQGLGRVSVSPVWTWPALISTSFSHFVRCIKYAANRSYPTENNIILKGQHTLSSVSQPGDLCDSLWFPVIQDKNHLLTHKFSLSTI